MHIKEVTSRNRRDFHAVYECEHCEFTREGSGYDDANFHQNVIPTMNCPKCGLTASENYEPRATTYPDGQMI